jgi:hypothetical protein
VLLEPGCRLELPPELVQPLQPNESSEAFGHSMVERRALKVASDHVDNPINVYDLPNEPVLIVPEVDTATPDQGWIAGVSDCFGVCFELI